jgi:DNA-binding GntR family transcriptional regulator
MRALRPGEFVDTAEMARRFGLSGAHLRGLLRATADDVIE